MCRSGRSERSKTPRLPPAREASLFSPTQDLSLGWLDHGFSLESRLFVAASHGPKWAVPGGRSNEQSRTSVAFDATNVAE